MDPASAQRDFRSLRGKLLKSHTMTSFDAYIAHSDVTRSDVSPSLKSASYLDSLLLHGNTYHFRRDLTPAAWGFDPHRENTGSQVGTQRLNTDELCDLLARRGLGDPRDVMRRRKDRRRQSYEDRRLATERAQRRGRDMRGVTYYLQKLKGQAHLDSAAANCRASAFCEQQGTRGMRTASATYRQPAEQLLHTDLLSTSSTESGDQPGSADNDVSGGRAARGREEVWGRIRAWLADCDRAREGGGPGTDGGKAKKPNKSDTESQLIPNNQITDRITNEGAETKCNIPKRLSKLSLKNVANTLRSGVNDGGSKKAPKSVRILPHIVS